MRDKGSKVIEVEQLNIFDVMKEFDESQAKWKDVGGHFEQCTVLAYIPKDALAPTEQWTKRWDDPERKRKEKLWGDYTTAIWNYLGFIDNAWEKACNKLQKYRDENKPCPMTIHRQGNFPYLRPEHVVEYLD